jgi:membrane fusion protein (multidrug efflux system)
VGLQRKEALVVPQRAVLQQMGRQLVYVVGVGDTVRPKEVRASAWSGDQWLIDTGLVAGDRVIVDGLQKVGPGRIVHPVAMADSAPSGVPVSGQPQAAGGAPR